MGEALRTIECKTLEMFYRTVVGGTVHCLTNLNFEAEEGEFISLVGPSGCGKTTLLKIFSGLLHPSKGEALIKGKPVKGPSPDVGMVFQHAVLMEWRTVTQNVLLPVEIRKLNPRAFKDKATDLLKLAGLMGFEDRLPHELSGGMQQRVCICRALIQDPPVLLMDEPFGALDAFTRETMNLELLRIWNEKKKTVLFITHSISEAVFLSDRVGIMTSRPGTITRFVKVPLPRPRTIDMMAAPEFSRTVLEIRGYFNSKGGID